MPSQLGCAMGCTFCVSGQGNRARNLTSEELLELAGAGIARLDPSRQVEISFTGEGEPLLNWKNIQTALAELKSGRCPALSLRLSLSGFAPAALLDRWNPIPHVRTRLQVSLHCATQQKRDRFVPRAAPLDELKAALLAHQHKFDEVTVNVVLQAGLTDADEDLVALLQWVEPSWAVTLNPLLLENGWQVSPRTEFFAEELRAAGLDVSSYSNVAREISRQALYPHFASKENRVLIAQDAA